VLAVFSASALQQPRQASPERVGEYSQTRLFYRALWKSVKRNGDSLNHGHGLTRIFTDKKHFFALSVEIREIRGVLFWRD